MLIAFLLQDNGNVDFHLESLKENFLFSYFLKQKQDIYIFFIAYKILRAIFKLFFSNLFQSTFSDVKVISTHLSYFFYTEGLNFFIISRLFPISSWFKATIKVYWKHWLSFLLMEFIVAFLFLIQSGESIYDPLRLGFILWHLHNN